MTFVRQYCQSFRTIPIVELYEPAAVTAWLAAVTVHLVATVTVHLKPRAHWEETAQQLAKNELLLSRLLQVCARLYSLPNVWCHVGDFTYFSSKYSVIRAG